MRQKCQSIVERAALVARVNHFRMHKYQHTKKRAKSTRKGAFLARNTLPYKHHNRLNIEERNENV
jgi:hypothetical protein